MDWTGGARRRFAPKKNNAVLQRQKSYFAKARGALNNTTPSHTAFQPFTKLSNPGSKGELQPHRDLLESEIGGPRELHAKSRMSTQELGSGKERRGRLARFSSHRFDQQSSRRRSPGANSSIYSRRAPSTHSRQAKEQQNSHHHKMASTDNMSEEERLLLANRRRLLAQSDWLGLAPTQPLQMKFSTSHDKDRVGKRRKVDSVTSKKGEPAGQRLFTPLFDERLQQQDHFMSGALPQDDFHFKIGTDALATQTQPSNRSHTPGKTSLRQPSTDFELLSEESMLLGSDEDTFDPFQATFESLPPDQPLGHQIQHLCEVPNMEQPLYERNMDEQLGLQSAGSSTQNEAKRDDRGIQGDEQHPYERIWDDGPPHRTHWTTQHEGADTIAVTNQREDDESAPYQFHETLGQNHGSAAPSTANGSEDEDEDYDELWRKFMNVANPVSSNPSIMAAKSSSLHMTTSESNHRPTLIRHDESHDTPVVSTPNGAGTRGPPLNGHVQTASKNASSDPARDSPSPSACLKQIVSLAMQPPAPVWVAQDDEDNDALWKRFVCGAQDDSDTSSQPGIASPNQNRDTGYPPTLVPASSSYMVSDLGTSNKTTIGNSTILVPGSMSTTASRRQTTPANQDTTSSEGVDSTRAMKPAGPDDTDDDNTEYDEPLAVQKHQAAKIHATQGSILNPKRFKPLRNRRKSPAKPVSTPFIARQRQRQTPKQGRSVYDLVDNDGNSVA
jgi:hypothetical protein